MTPHSERAKWGPSLLKDLTVNDSWVKRAYVETARAGRDMSRFSFDDTAIVRHANELQERVLSLLPLPQVHARPVDYKKAAEVAGMLGENRGGLIIMRHGVQFIEDEERNKLSGAQRKIRLMQLPYNDQDPADAQSLAEAASLGIMVAYWRKEMGLPVRVLSSGNRRAADIGAIVSVVNNFEVKVDDRLTCVNYPVDRTDEELEAMLGKDNNGALVWKQEVLDSVCGDGTFESIDAGMRGLIEEYSAGEGLTIAITHTPQTNAADVITGDLPMRMPELGMRIITATATKRFMDNVFGEN